MKCQMLPPSSNKKLRQGFYTHTSIQYCIRRNKRGSMKSNYFWKNTEIICLFHCVGICTNGAVAMMGKTAGSGTKLY